MSGHSKWANIKHRKGLKDAKKGRIFSSLIKKISAAARRGGGDPVGNTELRLVLEKARAANVPAENIERAILKATGQLEGVTFENFAYEGYGPGGSAFLIEGSTDNRTRTVAEIRSLFYRHGGALGEPGCVAWMFSSRGILSLEAASVPDPDRVMELALEHGAEDFEQDDEMITITTTPEGFARMREALVEAGFREFATDEITKVPATRVELPTAQAGSALALAERFEEHEDVENVYHNVEASEDALAAFDE